MATIQTTARPTTAFGAWFEDVRRSLGAELRRRRVYNDTYAELASLSDRDLADIGVSRLQIADIARDAANGR